MAIVDGWVDWAVKKPGPAHKVYPQVNWILGWALHSQEGWQAGSESRLFGPDDASWTFSVLLTGEVRQHYPMTASVWTSSSRDWNTRYPSIEAEGMASRGPLNAAQVASVLRLFQEAEEEYRLIAKRDQPLKTLWEHRENPAASTACPSERYAPLYAALQEDDMGLSEDQVIALIHKTMAETSFYNYTAARFSVIARAADLSTNLDTLEAMLTVQAKPK